jgi:hypothetical protein
LYEKKEHELEWENGKIYERKKRNKKIWVKKINPEYKKARKREKESKKWEDRFKNQTQSRLYRKIPHNRENQNY